MNTLRKIIICSLAIGALGALSRKTPLNAEDKKETPPSYKVACVKGRVYRMEQALRKHFQFRKKLMDDNGIEHTCLFKINDKNIKCLNPNYVRSGGNVELLNKGYTTDTSIAGGHLGKRKAGTVCYFKKPTLPIYQASLIAPWLLGDNELKDFVGAQESADITAKAKNKIEAMRKILMQPLAGE